MSSSRRAAILVPLIFSVTLAAACASGGGGAPPSDSGVPKTGVVDSAAPAGASAPMVQPGAPGQATRSIDSGDLAELGGVAWTEADVHFMQMMIPHHAQALAMTALVDQHATTEAVRRMALRMEISQRDEIALMERWLRERDQAVPDWRAGGHTDHGTAGMAMMPGMLTPAQMDRLRGARGPEFDRIFLQSMIQHHEGAIVMVRDLFLAPGGGQESEIFQFAAHVDADQTAEIERMRGILESMR